MTDSQIVAPGVTQPPVEVAIQRQTTITRLEEHLPPGWAHSHGSRSPTQLQTLSSSRVSQIDSKGSVRDRLTVILDGATDIACVCSFLMADSGVVDAMLRAHERGVRVYLLTASESQLLKEPRADSEFDAERLQEHIKTLGLMTGKILVRTATHFHSKFVLVDPGTTNAKGFLLTANLTSEALTRNVELAIELTPGETTDLFRQFLMGFWEESTGELIERGGLDRVEPQKISETAEPSKILCTTSRLHTLKDTLDKTIAESNGDILVSSFGFDPEHQTVQKLVGAARAGRRVQVFARPRPNKATMNALIEMAQAGAEVYGHPWLHAKCLITETDTGATGLVMTANFETKGLDQGFETGVMLEPNDAETLRAYLTSWKQEFPMKLFVGKRVGEIEGEVTLWIAEELRRFSVRANGETNLGEFRAKKLEEMEALTPDFSKVAGRGNEIFHQQTFKWTVLPPKPQGSPKAQKSSS